MTFLVKDLTLLLLERAETLFKETARQAASQKHPNVQSKAQYNAPVSELPVTLAVLLPWLGLSNDNLHF